MYCILINRIRKIRMKWICGKARAVRRVRAALNRGTAVSFVLAAALAAVVTLSVCEKAEASARAQLQQHLAGEVLRFHVLADSDSGEDQERKLEVRDAVLAWLEEYMPDDTDARGTKDWIRRHIDEIEEVGRRTLADAGCTDPLSAAVTTCWFPDRTYGDLTFPAGNYEALRIEIGSGEGHNWWCVLYPSLCFLDTVNAVVPDEGKQKLKNVLTEEEYSRITAGSDFKIGWYFW